MQAYVVLCNFNISLILVDRVFREKKEAEKYLTKMNGNPKKALKRCKELLTLRMGEDMIPFLDEKTVQFEIAEAELQ